MKRVVATTATYDADQGRIEPGKEYLIDDAVAERWIFSGIANEARETPPQPDPEHAEGNDLERSGQPHQTAVPEDAERGQSGHGQLETGANSRPRLEDRHGRGHRGCASR